MLPVLGNITPRLGYQGCISHVAGNGKHRNINQVVTAAFSPQAYCALTMNNITGSGAWNYKASDGYEIHLSDQDNKIFVHNFGLIISKTIKARFGI